MSYKTFNNNDLFLFIFDKTVFLFLFNPQVIKKALSINKDIHPI